MVQKLMDVVRAAGFSGDAAHIMYGICTAESQGNAWAFNPNSGTGDLSYGLAQINMLGSMGVSRRAAYGLKSNNDLFDPATNLKVAYIMSGQGTHFGDWSTYNRGDYLYQYQLSKTGASDYNITQATEYGSPTPNVDEAKGVYLGGKSSGNSTGALVVWATAGHWTTYLGKPLRDPPAGTFTYGTIKSGAPGTQSGTRPTNYDATQDAAVWQWMLDYFDDGSLKKKWQGQRPDHLTLLNDYGAVLGGQQKAALGEVALPDPGAAQAGIGPNPLSGIFGVLGKLLSWITDIANWKRIGLFVLGAVVLIFAAIELFQSSGSKVSPTEMAAIA